MTPTTDPFDARGYDPYSLYVSPDRDLSGPDREAVQTAASPPRRWSWGEYLTLAAMVGCLVLGTSHVWWPLLEGWW